jgi:4-amino-4-deoxy-L-arabinose transferase-like glycosyltransferase
MREQTLPERVEFPVRTVFWLLWAALLIAKIAIAAQLAPFGDEAFYWQESRALAWSYSDLPPATAWMIWAGEHLFGHGTLAMRSLFLVLGACLPLLVVRLGYRVFGASSAWQSGLLAMLLPLSGTLGLLALPDVPLTFFTLIALLALERCASERRFEPWSVLGIALCGAWLSHYRAAMLIAAGLAFLTLCARGRRLWRKRGLYWALVLGLLGVVPLVVFNASHGWSALSFQLLERHPWRFHADGLLQIVEQMILCTPFLFIAMLAALAGAARRAREGAPWDLLATVSATVLFGYLFLGCFADDTRLRVHWPLPAYLPLLILLPAFFEDQRLRAETASMQKWIRVGVAGVWATATLGLIVACSYFALAASPERVDIIGRFKAFPENFVGWNEVAQRTDQLLRQPDLNGVVVVADNFLLAAELDFAFAGQRSIYTLDHPLNRKHGRAVQEALWQRDEVSLRELGAAKILLVVDHTATRERERVAWLTDLCTRIQAPVVVGQLNLFDGRKRFTFFATTMDSNPDTRRCLELLYPY